MTTAIAGANKAKQRYRRTSRRVVCLGLFIVAGSPWSGTFADDIEPNDTLVTACQSGLDGIGFVDIPGAVLGDGDEPDLDVDIFSFSITTVTPLPVRLTVSVDAAGPGPDAYLRLFDSDGNELHANDDRTFHDHNPRISTFLFEAGTYYLGVSWSGNALYDNTQSASGMPGGGGSYDLNITTEPVLPSVSSFEPNDDVTTATPMGSDSFSIKGEFIGDGEHVRRDVDIYVLSLTGTARIDVEVAADSLGSTLDPVVRLRTCVSGTGAKTWEDPCGLGSNDDRADGSTDSALSVGVPTATDVYILVSGSGNRRFDPTAPGSGEIGSVGEYTLNVTVDYIDGTGPQETNDSIVTSTPLLVYDGTPQLVGITGFIGDGPFAITRGDRDFYKIELLAGSGFFTFAVQPDSGSDLIPVLAIYDELGGLIAYEDNPDHDSELRITIPATCSERDVQFAQGVLHALVMGIKQRLPNDPFVPWPGYRRFEEHTVGDGPGSTGGYFLTVQANLGGPCGLEPNDTLNTSIATGIVDEGLYLCSGGMLGDSLCDDPGTDVDLWSLQVLHVPATLEVGICAGRHEVEIRVFESAGQEIARFVPSGGGGRARTTLTLRLSQPGNYFVAVGGYLDDYDPLVPCSANYADAEFDLMIRLSQGSHPSTIGGSRSEEGAAGDETPLLFTTRLDAASNSIDAIDPATGDTVANFDAPESHFGGTGGLAQDGSNLFFIGAGRYPKIYQLDATTGDILNDYILWQGSGWYGDAVMLGGELFLLDFYHQALHVIDPVAGRYLRSMPVRSMDGVTTIGGGLAALSGPNRLYVADAFHTGSIFEVSPQSGAIRATLPAPATRPTALAGLGDALLYAADWLSNEAEILTRAGESIGTLVLPEPSGSLAGPPFFDVFGDFDIDGDIDLEDYRRFQRCFTGSDDSGELADDCIVCDRNGDGLVEYFDFVTFPSASTGP